MSHKKHVVFTLVIVMIAVVALSVSPAFAGGIGRAAPAPTPEEHPPVCYRLESFGPGVWAMECFDTGKDIINAAVKTNALYELEWNSESVTLKVYPAEKGSVAYWNVQDKNGSVVSGTLH